MAGRKRKDGNGGKKADSGLLLREPSGERDSMLSSETTEDARARVSSDTEEARVRVPSEWGRLSSGID